MKQRLYFLVAVFLMPFSVVFAQERNCGTNDYLEMQLKNNPRLQTKMAQLEELTQLRASQTQAQNNGVLYIPVVVHILWNSANPVENISDAQIISQMDVLYKDFRRLNEDADDTWEQAADMEIEYYLAQIDPDGNPTNGITRTETNVEAWGFSDALKNSASGGVDPWDVTKYFNIWVANLGGGLLGFAQFPGGDPSTDGVVMTTGVFGDSNAEGAEDFYLTFPAYSSGRTLSHEVGHFLNLRHIWGDGPCGVDDFVDDTPEQDSPTGGCPTSRSSCGTEDMFQNYMDYTDDACMNLFTEGQKNRMRAVLEEGGPREALVQPPFPYVLDVSEAVSNICSPEDASFDFSLGLVDPEFSETVLFSVSGLPDGASATFSPAQASEDATVVNLTITGLANASIGGYDLRVEGTAGDNLVPLSLILNVYSDQFEDLVLETPADGASDAVVSELQWSADPNAVAYEVELASDPDFNNILESETVILPKYSPSSIQSSTTYYWRVRAINDCGSSDYTQASFSTSDVICSNFSTDTAVAIPDGGATGVDASLTFTSALEITDVKVTVNITHTFTEDLTLILIGPSGTSVILSAENGGGGDNYINTVFDDDAEVLISDSGAPFTGSFIPEEPLSAFTGENSGGIWTLNVADNAGFDTGTIDSWSLDICGFEQDDSDGDGIPNEIDNCLDTPNNDQADIDEDGIGDACDDDIDGDGLLNTEDNCPETANPGQEDIDGDGIGDVCDVECGVYVSEDVPITIADDAGGQEVYEASVLVTENIYITDINVTINIDHAWNSDLALFLVNPEGEFIELSILNGGDSDNYTDTVFDDNAETPITAGTGPFTGSFRPEEPLSTFNGQLSQGVWLLGVIDVFGPLDGGVINSFTLDVCGTRDPFDYDLDTVLNEDDNCVFVANPEQTDTDGDGQGDVCDDDDDNDGLLDDEDNCPLVANADQADNDGDGIGDVCDDDDDNDGVLDEEDNCQFEFNPDQLDADGDGIGNACDDLLPNDVLTPNGDGINDTWIILASNRFPNVNIKVFNRWGKEVYSHSGEYNNDWDGSSDSGSSTLPTGSYFYKIDQNGDGSVVVTGWVYIAK